MNMLLKHVEEANWHFLKVEAAKERITLGKLFDRLVEEYKNREKAEDMKSWDRIFSRKPLLSRKEAAEMHRAIETFRKEYGFEG